MEQTRSQWSRDQEKQQEPNVHHKPARLIRTCTINYKEGKDYKYSIILLLKHYYYYYYYYYIIILLLLL